jgi:hypothetical protein
MRVRKGKTQRLRFFLTARRKGNHSDFLQAETYVHRHPLGSQSRAIRQ